MRTILISLLVLIPAAVSVQARTPGDLPKVRDGLTAVAAANEIRQNCDDISARVIRAYSLIRSLESFARSQGYSKAEIDAYVDSKSEKAALEARAKAYLTQNGVDPSRPATYCSVGRSEIAKETAVGRLLSAK